MEKLTEVEKELRANYRYVFSGDVGFGVLSHIITSLGLFDQIELDDKEAVARQNFAKELLRTLGIIKPDAEQMKNFVKELFNISRGKNDEH